MERQRKKRMNLYIVDLAERYMEYLRNKPKGIEENKAKISRLTR